MVMLIDRLKKPLALLLLFAAPAFACMWSYEHDLNGHQVALNLGPPEMYMAQFHSERGAGFWEERLADYQRGEGYYPGVDSQAEKAVRNRNDEAVALAHLGRAPEGLAILKELEEKTPGRYEVAANLGTSYELAGDDRLALQWITTALKRNPESHQGTEWLHQKILEAKIQLKADPLWLETHSVLGYDFGKGAKPQLPPELKEKNAQEKVQKALEYQLGERLGLVKPPDRIVADLLVTLAYLRSLTTSTERGRDLLKFALTYQPARADEAKKRLAKLEQTVKFGEFADKIFPVVLGLLSLFGVIRLYKWWRE